MLVDRSPASTADHALFLPGTRNKLELRAAPGCPTPAIDLQVAQADWVKRPWLLKAPGPVKRDRRTQDKQEQTPTASALEGNTAATEVNRCLASSALWGGSFPGRRFNGPAHPLGQAHASGSARALPSLPRWKPGVLASLWNCNSMKVGLDSGRLRPAPTGRKA